MQFDQNYYRSQAQKRLRLAYEYARSDLESGNSVEVYHLCAGIAGVELRYLFSGPESKMWQDIRTWGRYLHFYPEYPIGDDYVDFAEPHKKIVIEVDSGLHDAAKDTAKDKRLKKAGYRIIRINKKYTEKDLEHILGAIEATTQAGKHEIAHRLKSDLPKNSEVIIKRLRNENTPTERVSKEDLRKTVYLSDVIKSDEFKAYDNKYFKMRPKELDEAIASIPLYK